MSKWVKAKKNPTEPGYFFCKVIIPEGGKVSKDCVRLWFDLLNKKWKSDGMIVTHWMPIEENVL